ncbi:MAG: amidohydrolase [bacterium]
MSRSLAILRARLRPSRGNGADGLLVRDGRIALVGASEEIVRALPPDAERVEAGGRVLVPGFQDAHFHFLQYGRVLLRPSLARCASREEMLAAIDGAHRARPDGGLLFLEGWDESAWTPARAPVRADLDAIAPDRPVVARRVCGHFAVANGAALARLAERWPGDGVAADSGHVVEEPALELDELFPPDDVEGPAALRAAGAACLALGITTASDFLRPRGLAVYARALAREELPVRVTAWVLPECFAKDGSIPGDPGVSDRFVVRGLKVFFDGTIGGRTAALFADYADRPGERGRLLLSGAELRELVLRAHGVGRPVAIHTIGDRAIAAALDVFEALPREEILECGHRLEHVELPRAPDRARLARLGVRPCVQPNFLRWAGPGGLYETALGSERVRAMNPFRSLLEEGCRPFFGSDGMPASPSLGIRWALDHPVASERLSLDDAVRLYTEAAATPGRAARGRLEAGEPADLALLADLPDRLEGDGLADLTWIDGRAVHRVALEAPRAP